jgi:phytoene/squalene synthetase
VGQLVLYLFGAADSRTIPLSDNICTALQLANFWQDISVDKAKGRIYIPLEDFDRFGYTEHDFGRGIADGRFKDLIKFEVDRTRDLFRAGEPLVRAVGKDLRLELTLTIMGGNAILDKIEQAGYDVLTRRPVLTLADKLTLMARAAVRTTLWKPRFRQ